VPFLQCFGCRHKQIPALAMVSCRVDGDAAMRSCRFSIVATRQHSAGRSLKEKPRRGAGASVAAQGRRSSYSCPYFRSTSRHELPTRQLWAASVAPHCSRLLQVIPAERSHSRAAAGLHGASSARSMAPALVLKAPRIRHAASTIFIMEKSPLVYGRGAAANAL